MTHSSFASAGPVLFIGGWGRSGSTMVERLLGELDDVVALGEVVHLWKRGLELNERCACGERFHDCGFWQRTGDVAFGGWNNVSPQRLTFLKDAVDRHRRVVHTLKRTPSASLRPLIIEYASYFQKVYAAAQRITGARVVEDSSKEVPTALAISHHPRLDLRVAHLVRDSRGVAFSWAKKVQRPETDSTKLMTRYSSAKSTLFWLSGNLLPEGLKYRKVPTCRIRYEDVVLEPQATLAHVWEQLNLPGEVHLLVNNDSEVELRITHSVSGNPMRFKHGLTRIRPDEEWKERMGHLDRAIVTSLSFPLLRHYGYPIRNGRREA